jgi:tetratricopeptide (TPR) repeat protein
MAFADALLGGPLYTADRAIHPATAEAALTKVLSMVPEHALAHAWMGLVQIFTNRAAQGMAECERALALDRNLAIAHGYIGVAKYCVGRGEDTEAHVLEALRLSPLDTNAYLWMYIASTAKFYLGSDEEALAWSLRSVETNRNYPMAHFLLAAAFAQLGRLEEATGAVRAGLALDPGFTIRRFRVGVMSSNPTYLAQRERSYEGMRRAGVPEG